MPSGREFWNLPVSPHNGTNIPHPARKVSLPCPYLRRDRYNCCWDDNKFCENPRTSHKSAPESPPDHRQNPGHNNYLETARSEYTDPAFLPEQNKLPSSHCTPLHCK